MLQNWDRLKVFYHVFSEGSILGASQILHVSPSAISQSLQKLESELQSPLFTRMHKRLVPTIAGEHLFSTVEPFIIELDICLKHIEQSRDEPFGMLRIGAPVEFGKAYFPGIMAGFQELYPNVTFHLKLGDAGTLLPMVELGRIDFAFIDEYLTENRILTNLDIFHFKAVVEEEVILACSSRYYDNRIKRDHSFKNLSEQNYIAYQDSAQTVKNWFRHHFNKSGVKLHVALTVDSQQAIISAIKHHAGLGIVATHLVRNELEQGLIVPVETTSPGIINQISLVQLQDKVLTLAEKTFQKFLLEEIPSRIF